MGKTSKVGMIGKFSNVCRKFIREEMEKIEIYNFYTLHFLVFICLFLE